MSKNRGLRHLRFSRDVTGIPVIDAASGRELGKVREWLLDEHGRTVLAFVAEGEGGWLARKKFFPFNQVVGLGDEVVVVESQGEAQKPVDARSILGKRVRSAAGHELGVVEDVLFDEETGSIRGFRLASGLIDDLLSGRRVMDIKARISMDEAVLVISE
jgi:uncharacterized protein YrrD